MVLSGCSGSTRREGVRGAVALAALPFRCSDGTATGPIATGLVDRGSASWRTALDCEFISPSEMLRILCSGPTTVRKRELRTRPLGKSCSEAGCEDATLVHVTSTCGNH